MKSRITIAVLAIAAMLLALPAQATDAEAKPAPREAKAAERDKEGAARAAPAEGSQQNKMKLCNVEAGKKNLKGDERRSFMSTCLKG